MFKAIRILTSLYALLSLPVADDGPDHAPAADVLITGETQAERQATYHTLSLFAEAGLELPAIEIHRHHDFDPCNGFQGLHRRFGDRSVIDICTVEVGDFEQRTLLHELGHAWTEHFLGEEHKLAFQQLRGWTSWLDYDNAAWEDNGAEQAAEIIVWALSEHPSAVVKIHPNSCDDLHDGYVALTGRQPLHGYTKPCNASIATANRS